MSNSVTSLEISKAQQEEDIASINLAAENVVNAYSAVSQIASRYGYPANALQDFLATVDECISQMFLVSNFIHNPAAADIVDAVREHMAKIEKQLQDCDDLPALG